jgi:hypothetical protein
MISVESLDLDAFSGLEHDDFARGFGAPHVFDGQVIDADGFKTANTKRSTCFDQCCCASDCVGIVGARLGRVCNNGVRAGEVLQMEPHGVLRCSFDKCVIFGLVCADLDGVIAVENLGVHGGTMLNHHKSASLNQFLHIETIHGA